MTPGQHYLQALTRRQFFGRAGSGIGVAALASLLNSDLLGGENDKNNNDNGNRNRPGIAHGGLPGLPHFRPRAKRVIFLFQSGGPSQIELLDYKPQLERHRGEELSDEVRMGQQLTGMTADQKEKPVTPSLFKFARHGECGAEVSELLPYTAGVADDLCIVRSFHTHLINHDPGIYFIQTGSERPGRPSMGAWVSYGLGSQSRELPAFVVLTSGGIEGDQPLSAGLWGASFLPPQHQGVKFRRGREPVLYLNDPAGLDRASRRRMLDGLAELERLQQDAVGEAPVAARIAQYELAFNMQRAIPRLADFSDEPASTFELYGDDARQPGTFAANCLMARRMAEQGVRFMQIFHRGWDHHAKLPDLIRVKCRQTDQASAALVADLKQRGLLDDTLVVWMGEFGRTVYCQGPLTPTYYGRDHHPRCFSGWLAGGGVNAGHTIGLTDDFSYNILEDPVHVHDLHATILHLLGIDHERLTYRHEGRDYRLTDIAGKVVTRLLA